MPLYTYIMTYDGETKVHQARRSNFTGWTIQAVGAAFPALARKEPALQAALMRERPVPIANKTHVWELIYAAASSVFTMHIVETRE